MAEKSAVRILAAAVQLDGGGMMSLARPSTHHDIAEHLQRDCGLTLAVRPEQEGFVTSDGRFLDRHAALKVAMAARQLIDWDNLTKGLSSEHMW